MNDIIICVAPYPGEKQEEKYPGNMNVAEEAINCINAGASIVHLHVRDEQGLQSIDTALFSRQVNRILEAHPEAIIEGSTGGAPEHTLEERCVSFTVPGLSMGSLNLGSVNLWDGVYRNSWDDILFYTGKLKRYGLEPFMDCFDLSHFSAVPKLHHAGLIAPPYTYGFVFDVPNALQYNEGFLQIFIDELEPDSQWFVARHHAKGADGFKGVIERGGHVRVGYEDGPFLSTGERAGSNLRLVEEVANAAEKMGRRVVGPTRAREILGFAHAGTEEPRD